MNQKQRIITLLLQGWISPLEALKHAGTLKLSTRVGELKEFFNIETRRDKGVSKFGWDVNYCSYRIKPNTATKKSLKLFKL